MLTEAELAYMLTSGGTTIVLDYLVDKGVEAYGDDFKQALRNGNLELARHTATVNGFNNHFEKSLDHLKRKTAPAQ